MQGKEQKGNIDSKAIKEIAASSLKLGMIGFGGIAGMVATIEKEMVLRRKWVDHQHLMDALSASYIVPGPNAVELVMHCGKEQGGRLGLVVAGVCYITPAAAICLVLAFFYKQYSSLPNVQDFIFGVRPAITALIIGTVSRLAGNTYKGNFTLAVLSICVFVGSFLGINEVLLIIGAGVINCLVRTIRSGLPVFAGIPFASILLKLQPDFAHAKLFLIFLKIGAVLYGSGYVLFAYMDESLVRNNHWLSRQQLMDAIAVGQITPGPILSSATFAGYLIGGTTGGILATAGVFLPSFFISFFMHNLLSVARNNQNLRLFLDGLSSASIAIIAVVGVHLLSVSTKEWRGSLILITCLLLTFAFKRLSTLVVILAGSICGYLLMKV